MAMPSWYIAGNERFQGPALGVTSTITVPNGLIGYWPFDSATTNFGTNTTNDISGAGFNGTITGISSTSPGQIGQAFTFDGATSKVVMAARQYPQSGCTYCLWVNYSANIGNMTLTGSYDGTNAYSQFLFSGLGGNVVGIRCRIHQIIDTNFIGRLIGSTAFNENTWGHVAFVWSGGTTNSSISIYLNATQVDNTDDGAGTFTGAYSGNNIQQWIGVQGNGTGFFNGILDDVRFYNRALSSSEITQIYNAGLLGNP